MWASLQKSTFKSETSHSLTVRPVLEPLSLGHSVPRVTSGAHAHILFASRGTCQQCAQHSQTSQHFGISLDQAGIEGGINFLRLFYLRAFNVCDKPAQVLTGLHDCGQRQFGTPAIPELAQQPQER